MNARISLSSFSIKKVLVGKMNKHLNKLYFSFSLYIFYFKIFEPV